MTARGQSADAPGASAPTWSSFAEQLSEIAQVERGRVTPDALLVDDLGLDSLAVAEVLAFVISAYSPPAIARDPESIDWETTTVGQLYTDCTGKPPA